MKPWRKLTVSLVPLADWLAWESSHWNQTNIRMAYIPTAWFGVLKMH